MTCVPIITLGGNQLPWDLGAHLISVSVERGLRRAARAEISFSDPGFVMLTDKARSFAPGTEVAVSFPDARGAAVKVFAGTVSGLLVSCPDEGDHHTAVTIVAEDAAHGLGSVGRTVNTANAPLTDALQAALTPHVRSVRIAGLPAGARDAVIVACSPLELLEQISERYGTEWWIDPADGVLQVAPAPASGSAVTLDLGADIADLDFRTSGKATGTVVLRGWDPVTKQELTGRNTSATATSGGPALLTGAGGFAQSDTASTYETRALSTAGEADIIAQATAQAGRFARSGTTLRVRTHAIAPDISPRKDLSLTGAGPLAGRHAVVAVRHDWGPVTGTTIVAGDRTHGAVPVVAAPGVPQAPPVTSPMIGGTMGLIPGLISNIHDPKNWGRVRVKLPTLGPDVETGWARAVLPAAGPGRGMVVPHRVDDEVLVGFEEGDLQRPFVLGAVHNGHDGTPAATAGRQADLSSGITTANGHALVMTDASAPGKNSVSLKQTSGHELLMSGDGIVLRAAAGSPIKLQAGQASITLDAQGNIRIEGVNVTVTGQQGVDLRGTKIAARASATLALEGTTSSELKGLKVDVTAGGPASVKGATVAIN
ncbi:phage baseplate assembly protein V [Kineosporia sp. NBRC 101731]|uniref:phage baseplate assembly protein V n=1 Tax=Kineosporia sp. NBRC 101731 TaxID=3032199 RepID=UPI0024A18183|nr:phage baseplate assembly protein V [Kineosporia sp. NBRC 101731]GLY29477.1 type IV secretion protein Rhs [Kineosporia sp. NBRC 101731]